MELEINDVAFGGKGVARNAGKAIFIPFTIDGERVNARIVREKKQFAEGELVEVFSPSPARTIPGCPYFGQCGGCAYQHIDYAHQLEIKAAQVAQILRRIGKLTDLPMRPIVPSPLSYEYRNRITVHAQDGVIGFYRRDSHELMDIARCPIAQPAVNAQLAEMRQRRVRDGHFTLRAESGARIFAQTNDGVALALRDLVAGFFPEGGHELLIDAYCGAGFFAKALAGKFARVVGIEWDRFAVEAAQRDALPNEQYLAGDVDDELPRMLAEAPVAVVIVDPPATGLNAVTRRALLEFAPGELVYVSCNPATLARDLAELQARHTIISVTPLDMFPQTAEIEVAVHLRRRMSVT